MTLRTTARAAWKDGWVAAWVVVTGLNLSMSALGLAPQWVLGAFFGGAIGMAGGYVVTAQRNYRRVKREDLEFQLRQLKNLELRTIARQVPDRDVVLTHLRDGIRQVHEALEVLK